MAEYVFILALVTLAVVASFSSLGGGVTTLISGVQVNTQ
jgi:Flp pilus assembly pilin Flp